MDELAIGKRRINAFVAMCGIMALTGGPMMPTGQPSFRSSFNPRQKAKRKQRLKMSNRSRKRNRGR